MSEYVKKDGCYLPGNWNECNNLKLECSQTTTTNNDSEPPMLSVFSPENNIIYSKKEILFNLSTNEPVSLFYYNSNIPFSKATNLCSNCASFSRKITFDEGNNTISIVAKDKNGNTATRIINFFIDTIKPVISKTNPRTGFADGNFYIEFKETNPKNLILFYGTTENLKSRIVNIRTECILDEYKRYKCEIKNVPLNEFDGRKIFYYFQLTDLAGNNVNSTQIKLDVDLTPPIINSINKTIRNRNLDFIINVTEKNFYSIDYKIDSIDNKWRNLCTSLNKGICKRTIILNRGRYVINLQVTDKAGNSIATNIEAVII